MRKHLPAKSGNTLRMPRYDRLPTFPVPLGGSGQTPPSTNLNRVDIDATISFYGQYVAINQQVVLQNQDMVLEETSKLLGLSLRMTEDQLTRDMMAASASIYVCSGGTNADSPRPDHAKQSAVANRGNHLRAGLHGIQYLSVHSLVRRKVRREIRT